MKVAFTLPEISVEKMRTVLWIEGRTQVRHQSRKAQCSNWDQSISGG